MLVADDRPKAGDVRKDIETVQGRRKFVKLERHGDDLTDHVGDVEMQGTRIGLRVGCAGADQLKRASAHGALVAALRIVDGVWSNAFPGGRINVLNYPMGDHDDGHIS